jgi:hypothetical protein
MSNIIKVWFRGVEVEVNLDALASFKVQRAIAQLEENPSSGFDALDLIFNRKLDSYLDIIPDENGEPYEFGVPTAVIVEMISDLTSKLSDEH